MMGAMDTRTVAYFSDSSTTSTSPTPTVALLDEYIYDLANAFNSFYHETKIMSEEDETVQKSYIRLLELTKSVLETSIDLLGFSAPERM